MPHALKNEEKKINVKIHSVEKVFYFSNKNFLSTFDLLVKKPYKEKIRVDDYLKMLSDFVVNNKGKNRYFTKIEGLTKSSNKDKLDLSSGGSILFAKGNEEVFLNFHYPHDRDGHNSEYIPKEYIKEYMKIFEKFEILNKDFKILSNQ